MIHRQCLMFLALIALITPTFAQDPYFQLEDMESRPTLLQILSDPQKYDGTTVRVMGFLKLEQNGDSLWLHKEDFMNSLTGNALSIEQSPEISVFRSKFNNKYVIILGTFRALTGEGAAIFPGRLIDIQWCEKWSDPKTPRRSLPLRPPAPPPPPMPLSKSLAIAKLHISKFIKLASSSDEVVIKPLGSVVTGGVVGIPPDFKKEAPKVSQPAPDYGRIQNPDVIRALLNILSKSQVVLSGIDGCAGSNSVSFMRGGNLLCSIAVHHGRILSLSTGPELVLVDPLPFQNWFTAQNIKIDLN